mmetsp:Transcript_8450/g.23854  ORF Transcript_8450/g.23854 Transcript_8450/m.23854 type:complete len:221 (-) Transcript_8450:524-1186(-)
MPTRPSALRCSQRRSGTASSSCALLLKVRNPASSSRSAGGFFPVAVLPKSSAFAWSFCSLCIAVRVLDISSTCISRWRLMNWTSTAFRRSQTTSASSRAVEHARTSSALTTSSFLLTGSIEHSAKTASQWTMKTRNCSKNCELLARLAPSGLSSFCLSLRRKRTRSRRLDSKLRSARVACVPIALDTHVSMFLTTSSYLLLTSCLATSISFCLCCRSSSY